MKLIYIEWEDATASSGWHTKEEVEKFIIDNNIVKQVGYIYKESKSEIVLASRLIHWSSNQDISYGQLQRIPKTWIRKRKEIKL